MSHRGWLRPLPEVATSTQSHQIKTLAITSLAFAVLQNICAAIIAINGVRLAIGVGSLAMEVGFGARLLWFHNDWLRVPMMLVATIGSLLTLGIVANARHLRLKPSARWRQLPLSRRQLRAEWIQIVLGATTLSLVVFEECLHLFSGHTF